MILSSAQHPYRFSNSISRWFVAVLAGMAATMNLAADQPVNHIKNGSFESASARSTWQDNRKNTANAAKGVFRFEPSNIAFHGNRSLLLMSPADKQAQVELYQDIEFSKPYPTELHISGQVSAEMDGFTKLYGWAWIEGESKASHLSNSPSFRTTSGWRTSQAKWSCGEKPIQKIRLFVIFRGKGKSRWDNLRLTTQSPPADSILSETPTITVPKVSRAPRDKDDPIWKAGQSVGAFSLLGRQLPADVQTNVTLAHSNDALHMLVRCDEPLLDPVMNSVHLFKSSPHPHDGRKVFADDSIEVFVDPEGNRARFFQLVTNAAGAQWDARFGDHSWNGSWTSNAGRDDSGWWTQLRIPFSDLGTTEQHSQGTFNVARNRVAVKQFSTFCPLRNAFAEPSHFARWQLGQSQPVAQITPGYQNRTLQEYQYVIHNPTARSTSVTCGVAGLDADGNVTQLVRTILVPPSQTRTMQLSLPAKRGNWIQARGFARNSTSLDCIVITPWRQAGIKSIPATVEFQAEGQFEIIYNQHPLNLIKSDDGTWRGEIAISEGKNSLAVRMKSDGRWRMRVANRNRAFDLVSSSAWLTNSTPGKADWTSRDYLPSLKTWKSSTPVESNDKQTCPEAKWLTAKAGDCFLRHINLGRTRYVPETTPDDKYLIYENIGQIARVYTLNPGTTKLGNYDMVIETAPGLNLPSPIGRLNWKVRSFYPKEIKVTPLADGYTRHTIRFSGKLQASGNRKSDAEKVTHVGMPFVITPNTKGQLAMRIHSRIMNGFIVEVPSQIQFEKHPFPAGKTVDGIDVQVWVNDFIHYPPSVWPVLLKMYKAAGVTTLAFFSIGGDPYGFDRTKEFFTLASKMGFRISAVINPSDHQRPWLKDHPEDEVVYSSAYEKRLSWSKGLRVQLERMLDPTHGSYKFWQDKYRRILKDFPVEFDEIQWDHEVPPFMGSYDANTISAFRKHAGIAANVTLNEKIIKSKYEKQWIDFACNQRARQGRAMRDLIKEVLPNAKFAIYSAYYPHATKYTCDWERMADIVDVGMCGYSGEWTKSAQRTARLLHSKGKKAINGIGFWQTSRPVRASGTSFAKALLEGCDGVALFASSVCNFNVTTMDYLARVTQYLPEIQPFLKSGKPGNQLRTVLPSAVRITDNRCLIALINNSPKTVSAKLTWTGKRLTNIRRLGQQESLKRLPKTVDVPPFEVVWFVAQFEQKN